MQQEPLDITVAASVVGESPHEVHRAAQSPGHVHRLERHATLVLTDWSCGTSKAVLSLWNPASNRMTFRHLAVVDYGFASELYVCQTLEEVVQTVSCLQHAE